MKFLGYLWPGVPSDARPCTSHSIDAYVFVSQKVIGLQLSTVVSVEMLPTESTTRRLAHAKHIVREFIFIHSLTPGSIFCSSIFYWRGIIHSHIHPTMAQFCGR